MSNNYELFRGKTLGGLFEDIYNNQVQKKVKISSLIDEIRQLVKNKHDLSVIAPIINDMISQSVRNDEHLIKLATIAQRLIVAENKSEEDDGFLSEEEKQQLLDQLEETKTEVQDTTDSIAYEVDEIKQKLDKDKGSSNGDA